MEHSRGSTIETLVRRPSSVNLSNHSMTSFHRRPHSFIKTIVVFEHFSHAARLMMLLLGLGRLKADSGQKFVIVFAAAKLRM